MSSSNDKLDVLYKKFLGTTFALPPSSSTFGEGTFYGAGSEAVGSSRPKIIPYTQLFQQFIPSTAPTDLVRDTTFGSGANGTFAYLSGALYSASGTSPGRYYSSAYPHIVKYIGVQLVSVNGYISYRYANPSTSTNILQNAIPFNYDPTGFTYNMTVSLTDSATGTVVLRDGSTPWIFDADTGYLTFTKATNPSSGSLPPAITFWRYEGTIGYGNFYTAVTMSSTLSVAGAVTLSSTLSAAGQITGASFNATSDYRIKDNIIPLDSSFKLDLLRPVSYNNKLIKRQDIGFIAHEVQEIYPYLVNGEKDGDEYQSINYIGLLGVMVKEIQDLKKENKEIKEELLLIKDKL